MDGNSRRSGKFLSDRSYRWKLLLRFGFQVGDERTASIRGDYSRWVSPDVSVVFGLLLGSDGVTTTVPNKRRRRLFVRFFFVRFNSPFSSPSTREGHAAERKKKKKKKAPTEKRSLRWLALSILHSVLALSRLFFFSSYKASSTPPPPPPHLPKYGGGA